MDMRSTSHLEPCDYGVGGFNRLAPDSGRASSNSRRGHRNSIDIVLPPLTQTTTPSDHANQPGMLRPVMDARAHYLPQASEAHYYPPRTCSSPREYYSSEAMLHYRSENNQGLQSAPASSGFYPSGPHHLVPHTHPTYGRRVVDMGVDAIGNETSSVLSGGDGNRTSGGSASFAPRPLIIMPPRPATRRDR